MYVAGGVSGAHINPAVTLAFAVRRRFPWRKVLPYRAAQLTGGFAGAALVYAVYHEAIHAYDQAAHTPWASGAALASFSIFATFPAGYFHSWYGPLLDQIVGAAFLVMLIVALLDRRNMAVGANLGPLLIGLVVAATGVSYGANAGYAINPARDLGPCLSAYALGWGRVAVPGTLHTATDHFTDYMWVPIVGPLIGGVVGVLVYDFVVGDTLAVREQPPPPGRV